MPVTKACRLFCLFTIGSTLCLSQEDVDIPTLLTENGDYDILLQSLTSADLLTALSGPAGPFTVFAPLDEAFESLPEALLPCLLRAEKTEILRNILSYHVVAGNTLSGQDIVAETLLETLGGDSISISLDRNDVVINGNSLVEDEDLVASNGIVHGIDSVLVPPGIDIPAFLSTCESTEEVDPSPTSPTDAEEETETTEPTSTQTEEEDTMAPTTLLNVPETINGMETLQNLADAMDLTGLVGEFGLGDGEESFTIFAPSNEAFGELQAEVVECLRRPENVASLTYLLTYHGVQGSFSSGDLVSGSVKSLNGESVELVVSDGGGVTLNDMTTVVLPDVQASNGILHVIDGVLLPPSWDTEVFLNSCEANTIAPSDPSKPLDIPTLMITTGSLNDFTKLLFSTGLAPTLATQDEFYTVFAPSDEALRALPQGLDQCLLQNNDILTMLLSHHIVSGTWLSSDLKDEESVDSIAGDSLTLSHPEGGALMVESATVVAGNFVASNGAIHVISDVLIPTDFDIAQLMAGCLANDTSNGSDLMGPKDASTQRFSWYSVMLYGILAAIFGSYCL